jgi:hypothetical protein
MPANNNAPVSAGALQEGFVLGYYQDDLPIASVDKNCTPLSSIAGGVGHE